MLRCSVKIFKVQDDKTLRIQHSSSNCTLDQLKLGSEIELPHFNEMLDRDNNLSLQLVPFRPSKEFSQKTLGIIFNVSTSTTYYCEQVWKYVFNRWNLVSAETPLVFKAQYEIYFIQLNSYFRYTCLFVWQRFFITQTTIFQQRMKCLKSDYFIQKIKILSTFN